MEAGRPRRLAASVGTLPPPLAVHGRARPREVGVIRAGLLILLLASLGVGSLVVLPIEQVEVVGHRQLSPPKSSRSPASSPVRPGCGPGLTG